MNSDWELINKLTSELIDCYYKPDLAKGKQIAARLANLLVEPTSESIRHHSQSWILIMRVRGRLEEACRIRGIDIARRRAEIEAGDFDPYPELLVEEVEYIQDNLEFQADDYLKVGRKDDAIDCLQEIYNMARRYGIGPDEEVETLYLKLMSSATTSA